ncbi:uncharacterized protein LOC134835586 [Culicoides brevitarsis]|uniref:uncharacterized protein LOC134835586 n=1 Tax=Culicoides brevitarsis TaxID=469753 RepID=UPI00307BD170
MGKFIIMSPLLLLLLLIAKVCHAEGVHVSAEGQGPFVLSHYKSDKMPASVVDYVRHRQMMQPRAEHEFNIPNDNAFNVLDIADEHGTKIVYIKNSPPKMSGEPIDEHRMSNFVKNRNDIQGKDGIKKETFQSVSTFHGDAIPPQNFQAFQIPFFPVFVPQPVAIPQRVDGNVMRDPQTANNPLYGGPGYGPAGYGPPGFGIGPGIGPGYPGAGYPPPYAGYPGGYGPGFPAGGFGGPYGVPPAFGGYPGQGFYPPPGGFYPGAGYGPHGGPIGYPIFGSPAQGEKQENIKPISEKGQEEFDDRSAFGSMEKTESKPIFIKPNKKVEMMKMKPMKDTPVMTTTTMTPTTTTTMKEMSEEKKDTKMN